MNWPKPNIPNKYKRQGVMAKDWRDWRWQMANVIRTADELIATANLSRSDAGKYKKLFALMARPGFDAVRLTPYLVSLMDWRNPKDPIRLQHLPSVLELKKDNFEINKVWEREKDFADGENRFIQQKYPDIVLFRLASTCHSFCRFCFEKERTLRGQVRTNIGQSQFEQAIKYIKSKPSVRQVLISGGDPLIIPDEILLGYMRELATLPQISTIRINTRALLHNPYRVTEALVLGLAEIQTQSWNNPKRKRGVSVEVGVHFNHPCELTAEALAALRLLRQNCLGVYNQTVLLKGINDRAETIIELFRKLREENVRLHYLSHAMPVPGTQHLRASITTGMKIMKELERAKEFRGQLPHFETSHYIGKQLVPSDFEAGFRQIKTPSGEAVEFVSDITGRTEIQP